MAYLGNSSLPFDPMRTAAEPRDADRFSGNGSLTTFTLSRFVQKAVDLEVFVENVQQEPIVAYDVNGTSLIFTEAIPSGTLNVYVLYRKFDSGAQVYLPDGSVSYNKLANNLRLFTTDNLTPNGNNSVFTLTEPPSDANTVFVTIDGMVQRAPVHYTTSGSTITFTSAPPVGSNVHVRHLGFRTNQAITAIPANTTISQPTLQSPNITGNINVFGSTFSSNSFFNGNLTIVGTTATNFGLTVSQTNTANTMLVGFANDAGGKGQIIMQGVESNFRIGVQGVEAFSISKEGYNLRPYQPYFLAAAAPGQAVTTTPTKLAFTNIAQSSNYINGFSAGVGTTGASLYYSDANDRFTAPISGVYLFGTRININAYSNTFSMYFYKNGALMQGNVQQAADNFQRRDFHLVAPYYLIAGDYVEVFVVNNSSVVNADNSGFFYGYLLG